MKIKIQSLHRLKAVRVIPNAMSEAAGLEDLAAWTEVCSKKRQTYLGKNAQGFTFWWAGNQQALLCAKDEVVVACLEFCHRDTSVLRSTTGPLRARQVSAMFTHPDYRGQGLMLGMHQYAITQFNLLSDYVYSPEGLKIWKALKKIGHHIEVIDGDSQDEKSWGQRGALLLIRKNQ